MSLVERLVCGPFEPTKTKQSFKDECDINVIMKKFKRSCGADYLSKFQGYAGGEFGDFSNVTDYQSALEQVRQADEVFGALPAKVRSRFENDAAYFLDFCQDPKNLPELRQMGLAKNEPEKVAQTPPPTHPVS